MDSKQGIDSTVLWVVDQLRHTEARIAALCGMRPEPGDRFEHQAQLREALECVNRDLIADAIATLERAATGEQTQLRRDVDRRQPLLAAPQLCSALNCVNRDLIEDAIRTLQRAARGGPTDAK